MKAGVPERELNFLLRWRPTANFDPFGSFLTACGYLLKSLPVIVAKTF